MTVVAVNPDSTMAIHVDRVSKVFGEHRAVSNLSLCVTKGEVFALLGTNGAGKSTTIKMLTASLKPTAGTILVGGHDVVKDAAKARQSFGIVFQESSIDALLTAYENMKLCSVLYRVPRKMRADRIEELLRVVDLWAVRSRLAGEFSGGMKRRLELARALLGKPEILLLDEPTAGLDPQTRRQLWSHILELNSTFNCTIFFTTHYLEEAEGRASRVAIIDQGAIVAEGTPQKVIGMAGASSLEEAFLLLTRHAETGCESESVVTTVVAKTHGKIGVASGVV